MNWRSSMSGKRTTKRSCLVLKRVTWCLCLFFWIQASATTYSQTVKLNMNLTDASVEEVLNQIEKQSDFFFLFDQHQVDVNRKVNVNLRNVDVSDILSAVFAGTNTRYTVVGRQIVLGEQTAKVPASPVTAQAKTITGVVKDHTGETFPGVSVVEKGTTNGTVTDMDGKFTLPVGNNTVLIFSFIGYVSQEVTADTQKPMTIILKEDMEELDEIVVIGYGTAKKRDLTGSVGSVGTEQIKLQTSPQAASALQGQMAGVNVSQTNRRPGSGYSIQVRGFNTITTSSNKKSSEPLVVIDGVIGADMNMLNPADIEKMDVLKDASATAIYGSRGANGVVIITTKGGKEGKNIIKYDGSVGVKTPTNLPDMMTGPEWATAYEEASKNYTLKMLDNREKANIANGTYTDWIDNVMQNGLQTNHNISLSGGNEKETHLFSIGYIRENGNVEKQNYERYSLKANVDGKLGHGFKAGASSYFAYSVRNDGSAEALRSAYRIRPTGNMNDEEGNRQFWPTTSDSQVPNPWYDVQNQKGETRSIYFLGNIYLGYDLSKELNFRTTFSPNVRYDRLGRFTGTMTKAKVGSNAPEAEIDNALNMSYTWDNMVNYNKTINKHSFGATAVHSIVYNRDEGSNMLVDKLPFDSDWYDIGSASDLKGKSSFYREYKMLSLMGRLNYTYDNKYLITATARWDGSSKLAPEHKWACFPSVAAAWRITEEAFTKEIGWLTNLKLRAGYGITGNDVVDPYATQATVAQSYYDWNGLSGLGFYPNVLANKELGWEKSREYNIGLDYGFIDNRISGSVDWYHRTTSDLILERKLPSHTGFNSIFSNVGSVLNRGIEVSLNTVNIQTKDFRWSTSINFAANHNEVLDLYGDNSDDLANQLFIGKSAKIIYDYQFDGIWQESEREAAKKYNAIPGNIKIKDTDGKEGITPADMTVIGNQLPKWTGGMTNTFNYKNLDLSVFVYTRQGEYQQSQFYEHFYFYDGRYNKLNVNYWTPENQSATDPLPGKIDKYIKTMYYRDLSFWRIGHISMGYNFPKKLLNSAKLSTLRVYGTVNNPFVFTNYGGFDPEGTQSTSGVGVSTTSYVVGLSLSF